jgi:hypothetical protein
MKQLFTFLAFIIICGTAAAQTGLTQETGEKKQDNIMIYPNPVTDMKFYVNADKTVTSVEVLNIIGQTVKTVRNDTQVPYNILVQLPNGKKGMYIIRVTTEDNHTYMRKILIK